LSSKIKTTCLHNQDHTYDSGKVKTLRSMTSFFFFFRRSNHKYVFLFLMFFRPCITVELFH
jgi:hypothetical protein